MKVGDYVLLRWGRERRYGQGKKLRLGRLTSPGPAGHWNAVTRPGDPASPTGPFTVKENPYAPSDIIKVWSRKPKDSEVAEELHRIDRESRLEATRKYGEIVSALMNRGIA